MSDEGKKAIEKAKKSLKLLEDNKNYTNVFYDISDLRALVNLIEKQQKEIEKLKEKCKELIFEKQELTSGLLDSTPNDKIKAKIEEIDKEIKVKRETARNPMDRVSRRLLVDSMVELEKTKKVLQSLLEEE